MVRDFERTRDPIDPPGVRDQNLLQSAVHRALTSMGERPKYPTVSMAASSYLHALISNHAFHNGNKRTALVATIAFLDKNGYVLEVPDDELFTFLLQIASHEVGTGEELQGRSDREMVVIARWLNNRARGISREERLLKFHDLRRILSKYGCTIGQANRGNRVNISRGEYKFQMYVEDDGFEVPKNAVHELRKRLHLTEEDGYDSGIFYSAEERVPDFIQKYRKTLDRLAKV